MEDLDQALEDSLEGFDDAVGGSGKSSDEIDILSPSGSSGVQNDSDEPLFEEATEGRGATQPRVADERTCRFRSASALGVAEG